MRYALVIRVNTEQKKAVEKWGATDRSPDVLLNAAVEELGEVAHAINHNEGIEKVQEEIVHAIGVLARLYEMVEVLEWVKQ